MCLKTWRLFFLWQELPPPPFYLTKQQVHYYTITPPCPTHRPLLGLFVKHFKNDHQRSGGGSEVQCTQNGAINSCSALGYKSPSKCAAFPPYSMENLSICFPQKQWIKTSPLNCPPLDLMARLHSWETVKMRNNFLCKCIQPSILTLYCPSCIKNLNHPSLKLFFERYRNRLIHQFLPLWANSKHLDMGQNSFEEEIWMWN